VVEMHVVAIHSISDPDKFWGTADESKLPEGVALHSAFPNEDGSRAVCLWEADSLDTVKQLVEDTVGDVSSNEFFEVNASNAQGLPG
jgi:hypothetical protein